MKDPHRQSSHWLAAVLFVLAGVMAMPTLAQRKRNIEYQSTTVNNPTSDGDFDVDLSHITSENATDVLQQAASKLDEVKKEAGRINFNEPGSYHVHHDGSGVADEVERETGSSLSPSERKAIQKNDQAIQSLFGHSHDDDYDGYDHDYDYDDYDYDFHHHDDCEGHDHAGVVGTVAVTAISTIASIGLGVGIGSLVGGAVGSTVGSAVGGAAGGVAAGAVPPPPPPPSSPGTPPPPPDLPDYPTEPDYPDYPTEPDYPDEEPEEPKEPEEPEEPEEPDYPTEPEYQEEEQEEETEEEQEEEQEEETEPEDSEEVEEPEEDESEDQEESEEPEEQEEEEEPEESEEQEEEETEETEEEEQEEQEEEESEDDSNSDYSDDSDDSESDNYDSDNSDDSDDHQQEEEDSEETDEQEQEEEETEEDETEEDPEEGEEQEEDSEESEEAEEKDEEEQEEQEEEPDPSRINPSDIPYGDQFLTQQEDGDIVMKSPVSGKDMHFYSNGDGTWFTDSTINPDNRDECYTVEDIAEMLRREAENSDTMRQDYIQGKVNEMEQRDQWDAQNQLDRERGYSDEMKDYRDWKTAEELRIKKQEDLEKLAAQYHTKVDYDAVRKAQKFEQTMNEIDARTYRYEGDAWDEKEQYLEKVDKTAEVGVNVLAAVTPGGNHVKNAYTFTKSTMVGVSEAVAEGKSGLEAVGHVTVRMGEGALGVIQNEAGNLSGGWKGEYGITVGTEFLKSGMKEYYDSGGDMGKAMKAGLSGVGTNTASFVIGKGVSAGFKTLKEGSADYMDYAKKGLVPDDDAGYTVMNKINNFLNNDTKIKWGPKVKGYNVRVNDLNGGNFRIKKTDVAGIFQGTIDKGALSEAVIGETMSNVKFGKGDDAKNIFELTGGNYGESVYDFGKELSKLPKTAARYALRNRKK